MNVAQIAKLPLALALFACSSATTPTISTPQAPAAGAGTLAAAGTSAAAVAAPVSSEPAAATSSLTLPALENGYQRFLAAAVDVPAGTTVSRQPTCASLRRILRLMPKSYATT